MPIIYNVIIQAKIVRVKFDDIIGTNKDSQVSPGR